MADSQLLCCTCKEPAGDNPSQVNGNSVRCNGCTKAKGRLQRMLQSDQKLRDGWGIMDDATKAKFIGKARDLMGKDMKKTLESTIVGVMGDCERLQIQRSGGLFGSLEVWGVEVCSFVGLGGLLEVRRLEGVEV